MEGLWQRSTFKTQQLIITTLLLTVHLRTAAGHQVSSSSSSSPSSSSSSSSSPSSSSLHPNELHQNTSSSTSTTLSVATAFLRQLEHYQREQHYGAVRRLLENEVHRSLSTETSTEADRTCLAMLRHALRHPLGSRWTAKCKWKDK